MDAAWLKAELEAGRSIESIARELSRHPSTVAYWASKHGLTSRSADKHRNRGGLSLEDLEPLVAEGLSIRAIGERLGVSYGTTRHWLLKYGLTTPRARRLTESTSGRSAGLPTIEATCQRHGWTTFGRRAEGGYRCLRCRAEAVVARRRRVKQTLVARAGGVCVLCGYHRSPVALQFHHLDPAAKAFSISHRGVTRGLARASEEADKCVLLCANCHAEVEAGIATLPPPRAA